MAPSERYESDSQDASPLGQPLKFEFSGRTVSNRFMKAAMTERLSSWDPVNLEARGIPSKDLINLYKRFGDGGIGLILSGNIMIEYDHLETAGNAIVPRGSPTSGERFEAFKAMATEAKRNGSLFIAQVSHPGRQVESRIQKDPISASDVQLAGVVIGLTFEKPHAATSEDIANIIEGFAHAAEYLEKAGFDGIELHGAHGYLIAQFLSQTTNQRTDEYGGSIENRARILIEINNEIRKRTSPNFVVGIKLNSVEFQEKGFTPEESRQICSILEDNKFDFVELSGGTYERLAFDHERESTRKREGFFIEFAEAIAPVLTKTKTYITGGFKTAGAMVKALEVVDGVGLARPLALEPHLCKDILDGRVYGAIKQGLEFNPGLASVAAGTQLSQISKNQQPIDLGQKDNMEAFMKDLGAWAEKNAKDSKMESHGWVDITSVPVVPYGTASV